MRIDENVKPIKFTKEMEFHVALEEMVDGSYSRDEIEEIHNSPFMFLFKDLNKAELKACWFILDHLGLEVESEESFEIAQQYSNCAALCYLELEGAYSILNKTVLESAIINKSEGKMSHKKAKLLRKQLSGATLEVRELTSGEKAKDFHDIYGDAYEAACLRSQKVLFDEFIRGVKTEKQAGDDMDTILESFEVDVETKMVMFCEYTGKEFKLHALSWG